MIQGQPSVCHQTSARVNVMPQIAHLDENVRKPDRGDHDRSARVFDMALAERFAAEQRAGATQKLAALGEMTAGIVHDFRNLLARIESGLRLAEKRLDEPEKVRVYVAAAREGIDRGVKLTSQLLAFAKHQELEAVEGDVNELLRNLERPMRYSTTPDIRIVLKLASDIPKCLIDPSQFDAAVLNLAVNARDAMPNGGELRVSTDRCRVEAAVPDGPSPGIYVRVRVKDSGQGMPPEVVRKVFDPFFTTKGDRGTGLGLPHVYAFMRMVGGHVCVTSEWGSGTTVDLLFPSVEPRGIVALPAGG
jgi:signal transduction histidine kinase